MGNGNLSYWIGLSPASGLARYGRWIAIWSGAIFSQAPGVEAQTVSCPSGPVQVSLPRGTPASIRLAERARSFPRQQQALAVGDSIAGRWPQGDLDRLFGAPVLKFAIGGDRLENTTWLVDQFDPASARDVKVVLSTTGSANVLQYDRCAFEANARALLSAIKHKFAGAQVYVVNIYQKGVSGQARVAEVASANEILRRLTTEFSMKYVDVHTAIAQDCVGQESCSLLEPNNVHPNAAGFEVMSKAVQQVESGEPK